MAGAETDSGCPRGGAQASPVLPHTDPAAAPLYHPPLRDGDGDDEMSCGGSDGDDDNSDGYDDNELRRQLGFRFFFVIFLDFYFRVQVT